MLSLLYSYVVVFSIMFPSQNIYYTDTDKNLSLRFCDYCKILLDKHKKTMITEDIDPKQHGFQQVHKH